MVQRPPIPTIDPALLSRLAELQSKPKPKKKEPESLEEKVRIATEGKPPWQWEEILKETVPGYDPSRPWDIKEVKPPPSPTQQLEEQQITQLEELLTPLGEQEAESRAALQAITEQFEGEEWLGRREITRLRAEETALHEQLAEIEKIKAEATTEAAIMFESQKALLIKQTEFGQVFEQEGVDVALGKIPEYRAVLESYRGLIQERMAEMEEPARIEAERTVEDVGATLTQLAAIEAEPEKYRTPEEQQRIYNQMSYWDKVKAMFNVSPGYVKYSPLALIALAAPHQEKLEWWHEHIDVTYAAMLWALGQYISAGLKTTAGVDLTEEEKEWLRTPFYTARGREMVKEQAPGAWQTILQIANPLYWVAPTMVLKGVRATAVTPATLRAIPEAAQLVRYTALAAKYPQMAASIARFGRLAAPLTEIAARAMTPAAMAARATLFGGGVAQKVVGAGVRVGAFPITKPTAYAASTFAKQINLARLNKVAATKGLKITPESKGFRITGKGVDVVARDPMELASFMDTGTLMPRSLEAWAEKIHIPEIKLGEIPGKPELAEVGWTGSKGEFVTFLGGKIEEVAGKTVYSAPGFRDLVVISESALGGRIRPQWLTKELAQSASKGFEMVYQEQAAIRTAWSNFELPSTTEIIGQRFQQDRWRNLGQFLAKTPGAKTVIEKINTSALEGDLAKQAAISWVEDIERVAAYKNYLMQHLHIYGDSRRLFGIKFRKVKVEHNGEMITVKAPYVTKVQGRPGASMALGDVLETVPGAPESLYILTEQQSAFIRSIHWIEDQTLAFAKREQAKVAPGEPWIKELRMAEGFHYVHRTTHKVGKGSELVWVGGAKVGRKQPIQQSRYYDTMLEGSNSGVQYGLNAEEYVSTYIDSVSRIVADQRLASVVRPMGKTVAELVELRAPGLKGALVIAKNNLRFLGGGETTFTKEGLKVLRVVGGLKKQLQSIRRGEAPPEGTIRAVESRFPELGAKLRGALDIPMPEIERALKGISAELWQQAKLTSRRFKEALQAVRLERAGRRPLTEEVIVGKNVTPGELTATLTRLNAETRMGKKLLDKIYRNAYRQPKAEREEILKGLLKDVDEEIAKTRRQVTEIQQKVTSVEEAVKRAPGVAWLDHPAFAGRLFPEEVVASIRQAMSPQTSEWLRQVSNISGALRMLTAALDVSAPFIQGLPVLGYDPALWSRATWRHLRTFVDPKVHSRYLLKHEAEIADFSLQHGGFMGGSEWFEAMGQIQGLIRKGSGLFGWEGNAPTWVLRQTYGRAEAAWGAFGDVSRIELWGAMKPLARNSGDLYNIAQMINKMTGVSSSRGLGISATQRSFESAFVFFAPRYTRAGFALIGDFFKGGISGQVARTSLTRLMTGGLAMYAGICWALGQQPQLDPRYGTFMSIQIGDHRVGIGGFMISFARFAADLGYTAATTPGDLFSKSRRDNPFLKFLYGKTSPVTSFGVDMITQKDFLGEPIEGAGDYARFLTDQVTPFALQGMIQSWTEMGAQESLGVAFFAEVWGLRTRPLMLSEQVRAMKDDLAISVTDMTDAQRQIAKNRPLTWDDLNELQRSQLVQSNPDLDVLIKEYEAQRTKRGDADMKLFAEWDAQGDRIDTWRQGEWEIAIAEYKHNMTLKEKLRVQKEAEVITMPEEDIRKAQRAGLTFRDKLKTISAVAWERRQAMETDPRYETVYEMLDEWKLEPKDNQSLLDAAYDAYIKLMYETAGLEDEFHNPLWTEIRRREDEFVQTWGPVTYEYVQARLEDSRDEPSELRELRKAKDVLRPYWEIQDELIASGKYPRDTQEQHEWLLNAMRAEGPNGVKAADYYDAMIRMMTEDRVKYDEIRQLPYIKAVYQFADMMMTPTVASAVGEEREDWRRKNPKGDAYLVLFYDLVKIEDEA